MIQTSFSDPVIPQGGAINEEVIWEATVPTGVTFPFTVHSIYGIDSDGTVPSFVMYLSNYVNHPITGPVGAWSEATYIDTQVPVDFPIGTFDCLTLVGYIEGEELYYIDFKIDGSILTVEPGLGASIVSTSFSAI